MLSPLQRPLCVAGRLLGERKRRRMGHESCLTSLGLRFVGRVDSALFLDLRFCHPVWLNRLTPTGEERPIERYKARHYEQRTLLPFKKTVIDLVLVKAFCWPIRDKTRSDHMTQNALATQNNEALWEGNGRQLLCTVLCYSKNKQLIIKDSLLCPWGKTALAFSLNSSRDYPEIFILL